MTKDTKAVSRESENILSRRQIEGFAREGYLVLKSAIPKVLWQASAARVLSELATPGAIVPGGSTANSGFQTLGKLDGKYGASREMSELLTDPQSGLGLAVAALMNEKSIKKAVGGRFACQIALRFPEPELCDPSTTQRGKAPKLDELAWHTDGSHTHQRNYHNFSLLAGVALTDTTIPLSGELVGNLCIWPQSHVDLQRGPATEICKPGDAKVDYESIIERKAKLGRYEGLPADLERHTQVPGIGKPIPLQLKPGDGVLLHPDLAHAAAPNLAADRIRVMAYYRLRHVALYNKEMCEGMQRGTLVKHVWADLPGVSETLGREKNWSELHRSLV
eukprot:CAMPEP_0184497468 /NCGR_PEP_ID=MMETSP0113_2-20130426/36658_1 /TAXON_ID=91329 /ORGANISM="Norrisiella sphaerica, Strain BC52" /LENGTH=333 /DNA_ID=CAMNT_0026884589 /DNA_START=240 /DNA_END=1237 /DNA_ORIENTATION=-